MEGSMFQSTSSARMDEHGFENTRIADVLKAKGKGADGSWLWCTTDDCQVDYLRKIIVQGRSSKSTKVGCRHND
ncbi:hypothetical protein EZV62_026094 [Acer yangbiense]|uniref:Uncharacterized protein n=1 Tax=Acer yangbiense TaxID=1000413 RepID=A0A5C7GQK4_9ROSI|nr:hypothetical protein EZV62_026094 [Acer yangbiense]